MFRVLVFLLGVNFCVCEEMRATCVMQPATVGPGATVKGIVTFNQDCEDDDIVITVKLEGLPPLAADGSSLKHGFHIHSWGDLTGGCMSTGGHYNPMGVNHGAPDDDERHVGDFGNLDQTADGAIDVTFRDPLASLYGPYSIIGRAVVLHEKTDDLGKGGNAASLANGNAGARVGCCVIGIAKVD